MTTQERLDQLITVISDIETGAQEYQTGDMHVKRANLADLYKERRILQQQLDNENGGGTFVACFDRR